MSRKIMVQGTMSNVGKSIVTAGILRVLKEEGYGAAPFKSQNMALNSFVTRDGLELGRAQAMQAEAAGIEPQVWMNPILLKPNSNTGSQLIVNGEVRGDMPAREYFAYKKQLIPEVLSAYEKLSAQYERIVIEGAGSPAEINLKQDDIVNMGLAELLDAPVILVADIDRGGVFAQIYGTVMLLDPAERARIKGILINKFRGDVELLKPGIKQIEELCGISVLGVLPYIHMDIDEEDSQGLREHAGSGSGVRIAVLRLPHISNYTDFDALRREPSVNLYYSSVPSEADMFIIPGSKNTIADLKWLREQGWDMVLREAAAEGKLVAGICGGYQLLGESLTDEDGTEYKGLGLLPVDTVFTKEKIRRQIKGVTACGGLFKELRGMKLEGYEIHMGISAAKGAALPFAKINNAEEDGCVKENVFGTYIHGLFDADEFRESFVKKLCEMAGVEYRASANGKHKAYKEEQYNALAKMLRENADMQKIMDMME